MVRRWSAYVLTGAIPETCSGTHPLVLRRFFQLMGVDKAWRFIGNLLVILMTLFIRRMYKTLYDNHHIHEFGFLSTRLGNDTPIELSDHPTRPVTSLTSV